MDNSLVRNDLLNKLLSKSVQTKHYNSFKTTAQNIFDRYALLKEKYVRRNQAAFVNKNLRKAIMTRSKLLNKFRQKRTISSHAVYKKPRNIYAKSLRITKKIFYQSCC